MKPEIEPVSMDVLGTPSAEEMKTTETKIQKKVKKQPRVQPELSLPVRKAIELVNNKLTKVNLVALLKKLDEGELVQALKVVASHHFLKGACDEYLVEELRSRGYEGDISIRKVLHLQMKRHYIMSDTQVLDFLIPLCLSRGSAANGDNNYDPDEDEGDLAKKNTLPSFNAWDDWFHLCDLVCIIINLPGWWNKELNVFTWDYKNPITERWNNFFSSLGLKKDAYKFTYTIGEFECELSQQPNRAFQYSIKKVPTVGYHFWYTKIELL